MTTDAPAPRQPASRLFKGTSALLLAMAVAVASPASLAKNPVSHSKPVVASKAKAKQSAPVTSTKARIGIVAAETPAVDAPIKEELVAKPAIALAPSPSEASGSLPIGSAATMPATAGETRAAAPSLPMPTAADKPAGVAAATSKTDAAPKSSLRELASDAAASTLTLLLPRIAAGDDALPLLGRSTEVASDLGRLLAGQDGKSTNPQANDKVQSVLKRALTLLGTPYRWGGTSPDSGFDCSGLVGYVFRTALGIELPRVSRDMARNKDAQLIKSRDELREGDLVFFGRRKGRVDHVGIYLGNGQFVHAPRTGKDVEVSSLADGYWSTKFMQARRVEM